MNNFFYRRIINLKFDNNGSFIAQCAAKSCFDNISFNQGYSFDHRPLRIKAQVNSHQTNGGSLYVGIYS